MSVKTLASRAHFGNYSPTAFGWPHQVPDLVPLEFDGVSFGSCARDAHGVFMALLGELVPLIPGGLHAGSCGAYSTTDDLPDGSWSFHRYGIAIDVNWNVNKMGVPRPALGRYAIPHAAASRIARKYGCEYGGDWTNPRDWMHFEIHLTPAVARTVQPEEDDMPTAQQIAEAVWEHPLAFADHRKGKDGKPATARASTFLASAQNLAGAAAHNTAGLDLDKLLAALAKQQVQLSKAQLEAAVADAINGATISTGA